MKKDSSYSCNPLKKIAIAGAIAGAFYAGPAAAGINNQLRSAEEHARTADNRVYSSRRVADNRTPQSRRQLGLASANIHHINPEVSISRPAVISERQAVASDIQALRSEIPDLPKKGYTPGSDDYVPKIVKEKQNNPKRSEISSIESVPSPQIINRQSLEETAETSKADDYELPEPEPVALNIGYQAESDLPEPEPVIISEKPQVQSQLATMDSLENSVVPTDAQVHARINFAYALQEGAKRLGQEIDPGTLEGLLGVLLPKNANEYYSVENETRSIIEQEGWAAHYDASSKLKRAGHAFAANWTKVPGSRRTYAHNCLVQAMRDVDQVYGRLSSDKEAVASDARLPARALKNLYLAREHLLATSSPEDLDRFDSVFKYLDAKIVEMVNYMNELPMSKLDKWMVYNPNQNPIVAFQQDEFHSSQGQRHTLLEALFGKIPILRVTAGDLFGKNLKWCVINPFGYVASDYHGNTIVPRTLRTGRTLLTILLGADKAAEAFGGEGSDGIIGHSSSSKSSTWGGGAGAGGFGGS